jgi:pyroglutamyl-peptidase
MPLTLMITGFGPFPGVPFNPSAALAMKVARRRRPALADARRFAHVFPTSYAAVERELPELIRRCQPDAVLMFGLAARTPFLRIETRAQNRVSAVYPDADRHNPAALRLTDRGPPTLAVRAPSVRLLQAARAAGARARLSRDAGRYLCNALFWRGLEAAAAKGGPRVVAFVHVPKLGRGVNLAALTRAGEAIAVAILAAARRAR